MTLLHNSHQPDSFRSGRWNTTSNPDLAFANVTSTLSQGLILDLFARSQHRPSFITRYNPVEPIPTKDVKRWNFRKAKWEQFAHLVESEIDTLPSPCTPDPNIAYTTICQLLSQSAKKTIPCGCASSISQHGTTNVINTTKNPSKLKTKNQLMSRLQI